MISNEEINDIMKEVKVLEEFGLSIKTVSETIQNEAKEQKGSEGRSSYSRPGFFNATLSLRKF